jgi:hypothetical protein
LLLKQIFDDCRSFKYGSNLTATIPGLTQQNFPRIASYGNATAIVWTQNVNGSAQLPILFNKDISSGLPAKYDTVDLADITNTDVAMGNGTVHVVWQDDNSGTVKYRKGTYQVTPAMATEINSQLFSIYPNPSGDYWQVSLTNNQQVIGYTLTDILGKTVKADIVDKSNSISKFPMQVLVQDNTYLLYIQLIQTIIITCLRNNNNGNVHVPLTQI